MSHKKPKITPTTNDALQESQLPNGGPPSSYLSFNSPKITEAHEPLKGEAFEIPSIEQLKEQIKNKNNQTQPQPLKVALIGTAPSSRMLAPFNDPTWTIWACSPGNMGVLPRVDAWFEIHGNMLWPENKHYGEPYLEWLKTQTFPIYMQNRSFVPNATPLPMQELVKEFGPYFFTSSFAWMMAMAMREGAKEIALYGIDMASRDEYILQRPGAYYFFTEGQKRGVKISAPYESDIMQPPALYGYSEVTLLGRKLLARKKEIQDRIANIRPQRDSMTNNITYLEGALEDLDYVISIFGGAQSHLSPMREGDS